MWDEGAGQGWGVRLLDSGLPRLSLAASGQCRLWAPEEPPSTHLIFPGFQLQLLQAKEPLWSEGPLEPRRGDSFPPSLAHTPPFSLAPPSKGADPTLVGGPQFSLGILKFLPHHFLVILVSSDRPGQGAVLPTCGQQRVWLSYGTGSLGAQSERFPQGIN